MLGFRFPSSAWLKENNEDSYEVLRKFIQDDEGVAGGIAFYFQYSETVESSFEDFKVSKRNKKGFLVLAWHTRAH